MLCRLALALVCGLALPAPSLADDNSPVACTCDPTPVPVAPRVPQASLEAPRRIQHLETGEQKPHLLRASTRSDDRLEAAPVRDGSDP